MQTISQALYYIKRGSPMRRAAWKTNKQVILVPQNGLAMAHLALQYQDGRVMPWVPVQCDMLEDDWTYEGTWVPGKSG